MFFPILTSNTQYRAWVTPELPKHPLLSRFCWLSHWFTPFPAAVNLLHYLVFHWPRKELTKLRRAIVKGERNMRNFKHLLQKSLIDLVICSHRSQKTLQSHVLSSLVVCPASLALKNASESPYWRSRVFENKRRNHVMLIPLCPWPMLLEL